MAFLAWLRGERRLDCGCTFGSAGRPGDTRLVALRAAALAALAATLAFSATPQVLHDPRALACGFAITALLHAWNQLKAIPSQPRTVAA